MEKLSLEDDRNDVRDKACVLLAADPVEPGYKFSDPPFVVKANGLRCLARECYVNMRLWKDVRRFGL